MLSEVGGNDSISGEVRLVKQGLKMKVTDRSKWDVISALWFEKWKTFVNFDNERVDPISEEV